MDSLVGQSLGRYRIDALLGEGGMGAVFKASDVTLQRSVAIKVMHPQYSRQADFQRRFLNEAWAFAFASYGSNSQGIKAYFGIS